MKNPLEVVKIFLGVVCVTGAFLAAALAPGQAETPPAAPSPPPAATTTPAPDRADAAGTAARP